MSIGAKSYIRVPGLLGLGLILLLLCLTGSCGRPHPRGELVVFCAASLRESFSELAETFEAQEGVHVQIHMAGSQVLAQQILEGARADVFAPAHPELMSLVRERGLVEDSAPFTRNRLVVIVPTGNPGAVFKAEDLAKPGLKVILAGPGVPAGAYARRALERLGILEAAMSNVVSNEENVKLVLSKILLGEADAGIVYVTDVRPSHLSRLMEVPLPHQANTAVEYPMAVLKRCRNRDAAKSFVRFVLGEEGQRILEGFGFEPAVSRAPASTPGSKR